MEYFAFRLERRQQTVEIDTLREICLQHIPQGFTHEPSEFCYNLLTRS